MPRRLAEFLALVSTSTLVATIGCGGSGGNTTPPPPAMTLALSVSSIDLQQDGNMNWLLPITISGATGTVNVTITGLPAGITAQYLPNGGDPAINLSGGVNTPAGTYTATVTAATASQTASKQLTVVNDAVAVVDSNVDTTLGVAGKMEQFMSTSFQIGGWTTDFFGTGATATSRENTLTQLGPQHIRVQVVTGAIPMVGNSGTAADWNFTILDQTLQPVLASADRSPEFQVAVAPAWMCTSNGTLDIANHLDDFAAFMANMVHYYNKGGFDAGGHHFQSASPNPIMWWGIFNEFNLNGLSANDYTRLYNAVVPAMMAVDPTIKLSALEFSDFGLGTGDSGDPQQFLPTFLSGVTAQVDVLSTHFYSTCNQKDTDTQLFASVPQFAANVKYFYQALQTRPDLANVPVWVTENNVNADFSNNGMSQCNSGQVFVDDHRGSSAYFAAWRPYVFSQLGKAGNRSLYQWDYSADQQYGEVDGNGNPFLSYWVDKALGSIYPSTTAAPGQDILTVSATDPTTVETLATRDANGVVTVMVANRAVHAANDNNGSGDPRTVIIEPSNWTTFTSASLLTIDANTDISAGPKSKSLQPDWWYHITLNGYGVAFLTLTP